MWCWGRNAMGQLGVDSSFLPIAVDPFHMPFTVFRSFDGSLQAASLGPNYSCGLNANGRVFCLGNNTDGQLGDGTTTSRTLPTTVNQLSTLEPIVVSMSAGKQGHTCAVGSSGRCRCWGSNLHGELGDGSTQNSLNPVLVAGAQNDHVMVAAGRHHTCSIRSSRRVTCWGRNDHGELGIGTTTSSMVPVEIAMP